MRPSILPALLCAGLVSSSAFAAYQFPAESLPSADGAGRAAVTGRPPSCYVIINAAADPMPVAVVLVSHGELRGRALVRVRIQGLDDEPLVSGLVLNMHDQDMARFDLGAISGRLPDRGYESRLAIGGRTAPCDTVIQERPAVSQE